MYGTLEKRQKKKEEDQKRGKPNQILLRELRQAVDSVWAAKVLAACASTLRELATAAGLAKSHDPRSCKGVQINT